MTRNPELEALLSEATGHHNTSGHGFMFEYVSTFALTRGSTFGTDIRTIESWTDWANRELPHIPRSLRLDKGVDRIITTHTGTVWAVQNKGYADGARGSYDDLTNFIAQAHLAGATRLLWVTSGAGLNAAARDYVAQRSDLDFLVLDREWLAAETTYPATVASVRSAVETPAPTMFGKALTPRIDQRAAVDAISRALATNRSVQFIAAPGAGKTLTSYVLHDERQSQLTAYFVPTLGLMKQTIRAWRRQSAATGMNVLVVCSDDTVVDRRRRADDDHWEATAESLGESIIRDGATLARRIAQYRSSGRPTVVFVTYHSSYIVVDAQHEHGAPDIDLVIADEAHYLAGTPKFGDAVKEKADDVPRVRADRRVYATATPKTLKKQHRGRGADSMDADSPVFGPRAFTLTIGEAIQLGILCGYKISLVAVPDDLMDTLADNKDVTTAAGRTQIRYVAAAHALRAAMVGSDTKFITYHSRVKRAQEFAEVLRSENVVEFAEPVWGAQSAGRRDALVSQFRDQDIPGVLTNVRCLNEGIDIPQLNGVMFVDPKTQAADIVQATGRALRIHPDKTTVGHIILPIPVPASVLKSGLDRKTIAKMIQRDGRWKETFRIIAALGEHDTQVEQNIEVMFSDWTNTARTSERSSAAPRVRLDEALGSNFRDRLISGLSLVVQHEVEGTFLDQFSGARDWLATNKREPAAIAEPAEAAVSAFMRTEAAYAADGAASASRLAYLQLLPYWDSAAEVAVWDKESAEFSDYMEHRQTAPSARSADELERKWGHWLDAKRAQHHASELADDRSAVLEHVCVSWLEVALSTWQQRAADLGAHIAATGLPPAMTSTDKAERMLAAWHGMHVSSAVSGVLPAKERDYLDVVAPGWVRTDALVV